MTNLSYAVRRITWLACMALLAAGIFPVPGHADEEPQGQEPAATETAEIAWVRDYAEAKRRAAAEGKDLLINFTGSDWCVYCMRLDEEVFTHAAFVEPMSQKFVFVFMDSPRDPALEKEVADPKLRDRLLEDMLVNGFPTIILASADGAPYARTGYQKGGPEPYLEHLAELRGDGEKVKALLAAGAEVDATVLKQGIETLATHMLLGYPGYAPLLARAEQADADGSLGLKPLVEAERARQRSVTEQKALAAVLPQQQGETFDWPKIADALMETKHLTGLDFMRLVFAAANHLVEEAKDGAKARALLTLAKRDPMLEDHARAKEIWSELMAKAEDLLGADAGDAEAKDAPEGGK